LQKGIQAEDEKHQPEQQPHNQHDDFHANNVFREWAQSWARRTVIQNAIQMIRPRRAGISSPRSASREIADGSRLQPADFTAILKLAAFDRFVFVMSVLECYSDQECSLLLNILAPMWRPHEFAQCRKSDSPQKESHVRAGYTTDS